MQKLKIGFCSSGNFGARCLELIAQKVSIDFVVTSAPQKAGRGLTLKPTPVEEVAKKIGIPFVTTERLSRDTETTDFIVSQACDVLLVIDFGHMVKEPVLSAPKYGCINIHPSAVPQYRGSAPVQRAIMDGQKETAVSIFRLDEGMDTGNIIDVEKTEIGEEGGGRGGGAQGGGRSGPQGGRGRSREEGGLKDGIGMASQAEPQGNGRGVDDIESGVFCSELALDAARQPGLDLFV